MAKSRALLFGLGGEPLRELAALLSTAGGISAGEVLSQNKNPDPDYYFGRGKLQELQARARLVKPDFLLCNDPLLPRQERNLENYIGFPVLDRTALILDIFALHAKTSEGKLQVEIAQIEYNLTRMRGLWPHLERLGAGIGTRGPGESQIETDRRLAGKRLSLLRKRLQKMDAARARSRQERISSATPRIALFGYTNAGKSTLQNALCNNRQKGDNSLFHTLDSKTSSYVFQNNKYLVSDTVGLIEKLPHHLIAAFRGTLAEVVESDLILHLVDARMALHQIAVGEDVLSYLSLLDKRSILLFNKIDLLSRREYLVLKRKYPEAVFIQARGGDPTTLRQRIADEVIKDMQSLSLVLSKENPYLPYHLSKIAFGVKTKGSGIHVFTPKTKSYLFREYLASS